MTEAGYLRGATGGLDSRRPEVEADIETLRKDLTGLVRTARPASSPALPPDETPMRGPLALVPCDNTPSNGALAERVVHDMAELVDVRPRVVASRLSARVVTTMVDRITPRATPEDIRAVVEATGLDDRRPVVSRAFS